MGELKGSTTRMFDGATAFKAKFGAYGPEIQTEICQALERIGKSTDKETIAQHYYVKPSRTLYVLPDQGKEAVREYLKLGGDGLRMALLHTKRVIGVLKMNLVEEWEDFRIMVLANVIHIREIVDEDFNDEDFNRKINDTVDDWATGREYTSFQAQLQMNLACSERYLVRSVVLQWDDYSNPEMAMFPNVFHDESSVWDANRNIPYRLDLFLKSVNREIHDAPAWYTREKDEYVNYMTRVEANVRLLLKQRLQNAPLVN